MKSSFDQINPVQCRINVEIPALEVSKAFAIVLQKIRKKAKVQGFRPGKAPLGMIKKLYGEHVSAEVGENIINENLYKAIDEHTLRPVASPVVETKIPPTEGEDYSFSAVIDILPQLTFDDYKGMEIQAKRYAVKEETLDLELKRLTRQHANSKPILDGELSAANGHMAVISHTAAADGRDLPELNTDNLPVALGHGEVFEGLEKAIYGMAPGGKKTVPITLPEDYQDQDLAGKTVTFQVQLNDLKKLEIPELNDDFAKDLEFESKDALVFHLKERLAQAADDRRRRDLETKILSTLIERHPFDVPPAMVDQIIDSMIQELPHRSQEMRDQSLENRELRNNFRDAAKRRAQNTLILWHVSQKENIEVKDEDLNEGVEKTIQSFGGSPDPKQIQTMRKNIKSRLRENMLFTKSMDFLIDSATIKDEAAEL